MLSLRKAGLRLVLYCSNITSCIYMIFCLIHIQHALTLIYTATFATIT